MSKYIITDINKKCSLYQFYNAIIHREGTVKGIDSSTDCFTLDIPLNVGYQNKTITISDWWYPKYDDAFTVKKKK